VSVSLAGRQISIALKDKAAALGGPTRYGALKPPAAFGDSFMRAFATSTLVGVSFLALVAPAAAQQVASDAPDELVSDIVVTAQKREERLQDVPVAITVVSGAALERSGAQTLENAQYLVPSLNFRKSGTALNQSLYLRGIGTTTFSIGGEPSVSTVLDGVVLSRAGEAFTDLVDIERIEVLRGPQGTLFGKNASAGVVNIVSRRPGDSLAATVEGGLLFNNGTEYRVRGAVDIPLGEIAAARLTGFYSSWDGNIFNETLDRRVNGHERYGFRGIVEVNPSDDVQITLIGDWRKSNDDCCAEVIGRPAVTPAGAPQQPFLDRAAVALPPLEGKDSRRIRQNLLTQALETSWGLSAQVDVTLDDITVTSITAYRSYDSSEIRDGDWLDTVYVGVNQLHDVGPQTGNTFSQELRLASPGGQLIDYVVGAFYSRAESERTFTRSLVRCTASSLAPAGPLTPCSTAPAVSTVDFPQSSANFGTVFTNLAAFGQATVNLSERLRLIGGLRYTIDQVDGFHIRRVIVPGANAAFDSGVFASVAPGLPNGNTAAANGIPFRQKATGENLSGRAGVQFDLNDDLMVYGTYARGYKGPGLNIFFGLTANGTRPLANELADSFEGGLKSSLFDGRMVLNVAGYYAKYRNFQANNPDLDPLGNRITRFTNAGTISTRGFEVDVIVQPVEDFNLTGGIAYTDARVDRFRLPPGGTEAERVPDGTRLPFAPEWKGTLGGTYTIRTGGFADVELGGQASYQSSQLSLLLPNALARANGTIDAYALVDASIALVDPDDRFRITFLAKNLFDTSFAASIVDGGPFSAPTGADGTGTSSYRYIIPREADRYFGITGRFNF
jgi:iron complex outermembrane recepter protein